MITNLRPRILNKEASPSVVKGTEMLDAVNIVADGLESGEQNTVKKIPGTIDVFLNDSNDSYLNTLLGTAVNRTAVVLGHCVDKDRNRVFYFTSEYKTSAGTGSVGKVYMMEQFSPDEIKIVVLGTISDIFPEDFVAANVIRIPVSDEDYNVDQDFSGVQEDSDTIFEFDDSVDITDIQGQITVISGPSFPTMVENPTLDPPSVQGILTIQNTGGAIAYNTFFEFGEGISPEDPQDYQRLEISIGDGPSELSPGQQYNLPVTITSLGGVDPGTYDFYITVISQNYTQVIPVSFTVDVEVLEVVPPEIRFQVAGPGATNFIVGNEPQIFLGPIVENSGTVSEATLTFINVEPPPGSVVEPLTISMSLGVAQNAVTPSVGEFDTAGTTLQTGSFVGTLTDPNQVMEVKLTLRDDNGPFIDVAYDIDINFSTPADVTVLQDPDDSLLYDGFDMTLNVFVSEEEIILPADIQTSGFSNQEVGLFPHVIYDQVGGDSVPLDGSSQIITVGTIFNNGDEDGHIFLNLRGSLSGAGLEQLLAMNRIGLRYKLGPVSSGTWKQMFSMDTIYTPLLGIDDGFDTGADISEFSETLAGGNSLELHIRIENTDPSCTAGILDNFGETYEDDVLINENSAIGAFGILQTLRVEVHQIPSPDTILADVGGETYNNQGSSNIAVKGFFDIETIVSTSEPILGETSVEFRTSSTTGDVGQQGGPLSPGLVKYYPRAHYNMFTDPTQILLDDIQASGVAPYNGDLSFGEGIGFSIVNTSVADINGADPSISVNINCAFQDPNLFSAFGAGQDIHDPNPFQGVFGAIGSLGPVLVYTDPISFADGSIQDFDEDDLSNYTNAAYTSGLAYAANSSSHEHFGACRQFSITIPSQSIVFVAVKPEFSSYFSSLETPGGAYDSYFDDNFYGSYAVITAQIGGSTTNPGSINNRVMFPITQNQYDWLDAIPDFGDTPPPPFAETKVNQVVGSGGGESEGQVIATKSFKDPSEIGSLTSAPRKIVKKSASSNKTKKKIYGK